MELTISHALPEDEAALCELFAMYDKELRQFEMAYDLDEKSLPDFVRGRIRSKLALAAVAKQDGAVVGFLFGNITRFSGYSYKGSPLYGYISDTYVLPEYRRKNVASELSSFAENWLTENDVHYLELRVLEGNAKAHAFWQKQGFNPTTRIYGKEL